MKPISILYGLIVSLRRRLYKWGLISPYRPKAFTISVGNIVAGGAGKTPCTLFLAELLLKHGPVAIVARPYKAEAEKSALPFRVDPSKHQAKLVGDEALLLAKRLPEVAVWVGKKAKAAKMAEDAGAKVIIVDDGFQHVQLARDLDIVMVDAKEPCKGLCREPLSALSRASCVILNSRGTIVDTAALKKKLLRYTQAPIFTATYTLDGFYDLQNKKQAPLKKAAIFCAIANPLQYKKTVESQGIEVVDCLYGKDHEAFTTDELTKFVQQAKAHGAEALICTEKDRVKIEMHTLPILWLKISLTLPIQEEQDIFTRLLFQAVY